MAGTRPILFSIALILVCGFAVVDSAIRGGSALLGWLGMFAGLGYAAFGLLYGVEPVSDAGAGGSE